jgi:mannosyl-3-phosphoglycerate phosphatase family protein
VTRLSALNQNRWILFADLDGTVLDHETYEPGPSREALARCRGAGIPVVFSSSKTVAEIERYHSRYASHPGAPLIVENGGGVFLPREHWDEPAGAEPKGRFWEVALGARHAEVLRVLTEAAGRIGMRIQTLSGMMAEEIARRTRLSLEEARLAGQRDFDEPFWVEEKDLPGLGALQTEMEAAGMGLTRGGRCFHAHGSSDKGKAAHYVRRRYEQAFGNVCTAAVGDAANDVPMFQAVDRAYVVKRDDGSHDPGISREGNIRFLEGIGPYGFFQAVDDLLHHAGPCRSPLV